MAQEAGDGEEGLINGRGGFIKLGTCLSTSWPFYSMMESVECVSKDYGKGEKFKW